MWLTCKTYSYANSRITKKELGVRVSVIVDLQSQKEVITNYLEKNNYKCKNIIYLSKSEEIIKNNNLSKKLKQKLSHLAEQNKIDAVFICTEPCSHVAYAKWALEIGLNILMDKPISTPLNLASSNKSIKRLSKDYYDLLALYQKQKRNNPNLIFELLIQRRYHFAFLKIKELVDEVSERTGVPITSFQTTHCDGQWRMPFRR